MNNTGILSVDVLNAIAAKSGGIFGPDADRTSGYFVGGVQPSVVLGSRGEVFSRGHELAKLVDATGRVGGNVGVWADETGTIYVDQGDWVESEAEAVERGQYNRELAIWDIEGERKVRVGLFVNGEYVKMTRK